MPGLRDRLCQPLTRVELASSLFALVFLRLRNRSISEARRILIMKKRYTSVFAWLALVYLFVVTFPGWYVPIDPRALDDCWTVALNLIASTNYVFGKDVIFSLGPLGYLIVPKNIGPCLAQGIAFMTIIHFIWAGALVAYLKASKSKTLFALFMLAYAVTFALGVAYEYQLSTIYLLLCLLPAKLNEPKTFPGVISGAVAAVIMLVKFDLGCAALLTMVLATVCWRLKFSGRAVPLIAATFASYAITFALLSVLCFKSLQNLWSWFYGTTKFAIGYASSVSLIDKSIIPAIGIGLLIAFLLVAAALLWKKHESGYVSFVLSASMLAAFKHGFVRQDGHEATFFQVLLFALIILGLTSRSSRAGIAWLVSFIAILVISLQPLSKGVVSVGQSLKILYGSQGFSHIGSIFAFPETVKRIDKETQANYAQCKLPADLLARVRAAGNPAVSFLPNLISYCPANNLTWAPMPLIQLYAAYNPYLDKLCADFYESAKAPRFIIYGSGYDSLFDFCEIDSRNPVLEAPLTSMAILRSYDLVARYNNPSFLLFERRANARQMSLVSLTNGQYRLNEWITIPESQSLLLGSIKLHPRKATGLLGQIYQIPPLFLDIASKDGYRNFRIVPDNLNSGLPLNCFPINMMDLAYAVDGRSRKTVHSLKISGPGVGLYGSNFEVQWQKALFNP